MADPFLTPTFDGSNYDTIQLLREHIQSKYLTVFLQIKDHLRLFHLDYFFDSLTFRRCRFLHIFLQPKWVALFRH